MLLPARLTSERAATLTPNCLSSLDGWGNSPAIKIGCSELANWLQSPSSYTRQFLLRGTLLPTPFLPHRWMAQTATCWSGSMACLFCFGRCLPAFLRPHLVRQNLLSSPSVVFALTLSSFPHSLPLLPGLIRRHELVHGGVGVVDEGPERPAEGARVHGVVPAQRRGPRRQALRRGRLGLPQDRRRRPQEGQALREVRGRGLGKGRGRKRRNTRTTSCGLGLPENLHKK